MNKRSTWIWLIIASALFAFIYLFERHWGQPPPGPPPLLAGFQVTNVTAISILPQNQEAIHLEWTNGDWTLLRPVAFPAHKARLAALLETLSHLQPSYTLTPAELQRRPKADEEFGFDNSPLSLELRQPDHSERLKFGRLTAPGDQVFVRVVGREDVYVVDASLLKLLSSSPNDWRDHALLDLSALDFDRINLTNSGKYLGLRFDYTNRVWRMSDPMPVRADSQRINELLQHLQSLSISQFVSDRTNADLDAYGLAPASLSLCFAKGTNQLAGLHFGSTNGTGQYFARRDGLPSVVTVPGETLAPWRGPVSDFRDHQLIAVPAAATAIEIQSAENFALQRNPSNRWQLLDQKFPGDAQRINEFLRTLEGLQISQFLNAVTDVELTRYGLTSPVYQVTFKLSGNSPTNTSSIQVSFGTTEGEAIYARRSDETSVYTVNRAEFHRLPTTGWQLRDHQIWAVSPGDIARLTLRQDGKTRELLRSGSNVWTFAPGSQGVLNVLGVEMAVRELAKLSATTWSAHGDAARDARFGITTNSLAITLELNRGDKLEVQFGLLSPDQYPYSRVVLEGEPWVFECSKALFELVINYLTIPGSSP